MMVVKRVEIGQRWRRKNGAVVVVTGERDNNGSREVLLAPVAGQKGRQSWKWELAVMWDLDPVDEDKA